MSSFAPLQRLVIAIAVLASFVTFLDGTVVNVALPAISEELGGGITTQQWVVDAYLITLSALILLAGSLSDAYGRVLVMRIGLIAFGIASVAVAAAIDPLMLIVARGAQGAAGALLVPSSLALITATMRGDLQARAIGVWTAFTTAAQLVGPLLGGLFVDFLSWRFVFLINVLPIGVTLVLLARLHLPEHPRGVRVDWWSGALCALGLGAIVFALIEQPNLGWTSLAIWIPAVVGAVLFARAARPHRSCRSGCSGCATSGGATSPRSSCTPRSPSTASWSASTSSRGRDSAPRRPGSRACR